MASCFSLPMTKLKSAQLHYDNMLPEPEEDHKECIRWTTTGWCPDIKNPDISKRDRMILFQKCKECDNTREIYEDEL